MDHFSLKNGTLHAEDVSLTEIAEAVGKLKLVDPALYHGVAEQFFG